jgi:BTG family
MLDVRPEAAAAAAWWAAALRAAEEHMDADQATVFEQVLAECIEVRCGEVAWQPDIPTYGSCGRQVTSGPRPDEALARAGRAAGISSLLDHLPRAVMWVNPGEVLVEAADDDEPTQVWPAPAGRH